MPRTPAAHSARDEDADVDAPRQPTFSERVFDVVRRIPRGRVASYGLVAKLAGSPRSARQVGMVLRFGTGLPWHRVVARDGRVVIQNPEYRIEQVARLAKEGVPVDAEGRVDYERFAWQPREGCRVGHSKRAKTAPRAGACPSFLGLRNGPTLK